MKGRGESGTDTLARRMRAVADDIQCWALMIYICNANDDIPPLADGGSNGDRRRGLSEDCVVKARFFDSAPLRSE